MRILILYGSVEGQTLKIADTLAGYVRKKGYQVSLLSAGRPLEYFSLDEFGAVIIGGSIHMNKYPAGINDFVRLHIDWLNQIPSAFFTVCMGINSKKAESRHEAASFGKNFVAATGWKPQLIETFAGAVKYTQYNFITRFIMKRISKREGASTDTTRDHEYTNWNSVARFAEAFLENLKG